MRVFLVAAVAAVLSCSDSAPPAQPPPRTVDLGDGTVASLGADGTFVVTRDGVPILKSAPGRALLSRDVDPDDPDGWHDPKRLDGVTFDPIADGSITFESPAPGVLHVQTADDGMPTALVALALASDDGFYAGLGERFGHVSPRGEIVPMQMEIDANSESGTNEAHVPVPFLVSSRGYGVFWPTRESGAFDVAATDAAAVTATFEGKTADLYFFFDRDPLAVVSAFTKKAGLPRPLPRWALGPMYWRNEWVSGQQLLGDAAELRVRHIPTTTLWIDNPWQTSYNDFRFDPRFSDPASMMGQLSALGYRVSAWSTPYLEKPGTGPDDPARALYTQAADAGVLVKLKSGELFAAPGFNSKSQFGMLDFTTAAGRDFWANVASRAVDAGIRGFKLDYGEDIIADLFGARLGIAFNDGTTDRQARAYPLAFDAAYHQALDKAGGGFLIVRASSWGGAAQADIIWPGDLDNGFEKHGDPTGSGTGYVGGLPAVVVDAQSLAVSGFPSFGSDTGGYRHGAPGKEALIRWSEHTALSVIMQLGGGGDTHAPWVYDDETVADYTRLATLHTRLEPYLSWLLSAAETAGTPTIRPLPLAYPDDVAARAHADDEYLLGPDLLVAPVVTAGVTSRAVHLPPGRWISWWDGTVTDGPADITAPAPLGEPPLFARAGALVPMLQADVQTLVPETAGTVVSAQDRADSVDATGWVQGAAHAAWDDGAALDVQDDAQATTLTFTPGSRASSVVATLDLRSRAKGAAVGKVTAGGTTLAPLATEADVRASAASAYMTQGATILLKIAGGTAVTIE